MIRATTLAVSLLLAACASAPPSPEKVLRLKRECRYDEARQLLVDDLPNRAGHERAQQLLLLASVEEHAGNADAAIDYFKQASFSASGNPEIKAQTLRMLGLAQARAKQYEGAITSFADYEGRREERKPDFGGGTLGVPWDVYAAWAVSLAELGRFAQAREMFGKAAQVAGGSTHDALLEWQRRAEQAAGGHLKPPLGSFWAAAYGDGAQGQSKDFSLIPVHRVAPTANGMDGFVDVEIHITPTGEVEDARLLRSNLPRRFEVETLRAVRKWRFLPKRVNCRPVPGSGVQRFEFVKER